MHPPHPTLAVLAGGQSTRMGRPKSHLVLRGRPVLHDLLDRIAWPGPTLLVTAPGREHPPGWERFGREVADPVEGEGPLRGLLTALGACETDLLVALTVDMPGVGREQVDWLVGELNARPEALGVMPRRRGGGEGRIEPFPSAYRRESAEVAREQLASGTRAVHPLSFRPRFVTPDAPADWPASTWTNLNGPGDVERFLRPQ
jgi:molybdopterin-guanine dinucleotide biosynthesis protein A